MARVLPGSRSAGFEPALMQGVFTPMVAGFAELYGIPNDCDAVDIG